MLAANWSLSGAASFVDSNLTSDYARNGVDVDAASGTALPRVPETKWNLSTRYGFGDDFFLQAAYMYTGDSYNTLFDGERSHAATRKPTHGEYRSRYGA